jgi:hypothetical protein
MKGVEMNSNLFGLIAVGMTIMPLAAQAGSIAGEWSGVGVPDPTSTQAPYDQLATLQLSNPVVTDSMGDLSISGTIDVTCIKNALYYLHPDPKCGSDGPQPASLTLSPTGVLTFGNTLGAYGVTTYLGGNTIVIDIAYSDSIPTNPDIEDWTFTRAPEPSTLSLLGLGIAGVGFKRKRKTG